MFPRETQSTSLNVKNLLLQVLVSHSCFTTLAFRPPLELRALPMYGVMGIIPCHPSYNGGIRWGGVGVARVLAQDNTR